MRIHYSSSDCPYCKGRGCSECSDTGRMVRTRIDIGDGVSVNVSGNAVLSDEAAAALAKIARLALAHMDEAKA